MKYISVVAILAALLVGCARAGDVVSPSTHINLGQTQSAANEGPYRLWGEWTLFINAAHDSVTMVPRRQGRFHLNALKFLEDYCKDCVEITNIKNNGDGTIDLTVKITHPFVGHPEYTAFDVKGIIMFNGSHVFVVPGYHDLPLPEECRVSWREMGDPEVLNPDGYAYRWCPVYESGSDMPIFNYWPGKYATGTPNAAINAYLDFHSQKERHIFMTNSQVSRTYRIWLPPGEPVQAGYAVEACWEPPVKTPVTDPLSDFPLSANQPEPYRCNAIINNGDPIIEGEYCCGTGDAGCSNLKIEKRRWIEVPFPYMERVRWLMGDTSSLDYCIVPCEPPEEGFWSLYDLYLDNYPPGAYRWIAVYYRDGDINHPDSDFVCDVVDFTIIEK